MVGASALHALMVALLVGISAASNSAESCASQVHTDPNDATSLLQVTRAMRERSVSAIIARLPSRPAQQCLTAKLLFSPTKECDKEAKKKVLAALETINKGFNIKKDADGAETQEKVGATEQDGTLLVQEGCKIKDANALCNSKADHCTKAGLSVAYSSGNIGGPGSVIGCGDDTWSYSFYCQKCASNVACPNSNGIGGYKLTHHGQWSVDGEIITVDLEKLENEMNQLLTKFSQDDRRNAYTNYLDGLTNKHRKSLYQCAAYCETLRALAESGVFDPTEACVGFAYQAANTDQESLFNILPGYCMTFRHLGQPVMGDDVLVGIAQDGGLLGPYWTAYATCYPGDSDDAVPQNMPTDARAVSDLAKLRNDLTEVLDKEAKQSKSQDASKERDVRLKKIRDDLTDAIEATE